MVKHAEDRFVVRTPGYARHCADLRISVTRTTQFYRWTAVFDRFMRQL